MSNSGTAIRNSLVAALGGFLFGFDTAVISGVEKSIQELWSLSDFWHGFTVSSALFGTVIGSLIAGAPAEKYGRKKMLQAIGVLYLLTSLATALTSTWEIFVVFRFLGGIGVGASSVVGPMYISEISPAASRGRLVALFQFNIVSGILIAFVSNYLLFGVSDDAWRWMLGVQAIPATLYFSLVFLVPESPRWLIKHGRTDEAVDVLRKIGEPDPVKAMKDIKDSLTAEGPGAIDASPQKQDRLFTKTYSSPIFYAVAIAMFNQLVGINAIMYYAPRIFEMTGLAKDGALLQAVSIGLTNMIFTMIAISVIDKLGRRTLLIIGSVGIIVSLGLVSRAFFMGDYGSYSVMIYLIIFIAFFALSQGAVIWVFISEIFPNSVRSKGQTLGSSTHWIMAWIISWVFPIIVKTEIGGAYAFAAFAIVAVLQLIFAWKIMPETKGKSLEQIQSLVIH
jgi:sugar porter (SP) family MFS transporter